MVRSVAEIAWSASKTLTPGQIAKVTKPKKGLRIYLSPNSKDELGKFSSATSAFDLRRGSCDSQKREKFKA